jgi:hypothetical protein
VTGNSRDIGESGDSDDSATAVFGDNNSTEQKISHHKY